MFSDRGTSVGGKPDRPPSCRVGPALTSPHISPRQQSRSQNGPSASSTSANGLPAREPHREDNQKCVRRPSTDPNRPNNRFAGIVYKPEELCRVCFDLSMAFAPRVGGQLLQWVLGGRQRRKHTCFKQWFAIDGLLTAPCKVSTCFRFSRFSVGFCGRGIV